MRILLLPAAICLVSLCGCRLGQVEQGRVIEYHKQQRVISVIPDFDVLPPVSVRLPSDPAEMGPEPESGCLLHLDMPNRRAVMFDRAQQRLQVVPFTLLGECTNIGPNDARVTQSKLPLIDHSKRTVTIYSLRDRKLLVLIVAEEHLSLPDEMWRFGDVVRYYYKDPQQALRLMNVSKTDVTGSGK